MSKTLILNIQKGDTDQFRTVEIPLEDDEHPNATIIENAPPSQRGTQAPRTTREDGE